MRRRLSITIGSSGRSRSNGPPGAARMRKKEMVTMSHSVGIAHAMRRTISRAMTDAPSSSIPGHGIDPAAGSQGHAGADRGQRAFSPRTVGSVTMTFIVGQYPRSYLNGFILV